MVLMRPSQSGDRQQILVDTGLGLARLEGPILCIAKSQMLTGQKGSKISQVRGYSFPGLALRRLLEQLRPHTDQQRMVEST